MKYCLFAFIYLFIYSLSSVSSGLINCESNLCCFSSFFFFEFDELSKFNLRETCDAGISSSSSLQSFNALRFLTGVGRISSSFQSSLLDVDFFFSSASFSFPSTIRMIQGLIEDYALTLFYVVNFQNKYFILNFRCAQMMNIHE